jgi:hypothetical protein
MNLEHQQKQLWRSVRVYLRQIERHYGAGNFDDAGDAFAVCVLRIEVKARCRSDFETSHSNPWFHVMVFEARGLTDAVWVTVQESLPELGLIENDD